MKTQSQTTRPPVVAIMGHIDHGKSTLLDYIRKSNVVDGEFGGITQHLSAYEITLPYQSSDRSITFLDTPGHAAFTGMRERGASAADIAVLVVSAEDGVKAQTLEALKTIREAKIPFVVAINKIDLPDANIEKTKLSLAEHEVLVEGYGGDIPWNGISAKKGDGVQELLETILLVADLAELTYDKGAFAEGIVIESKLDPKRGITATIVIKNGTLKKSQFVVAGKAFATTRIMENFLGKVVSEVPAGVPVQLVGFDTLPEVGASIKTFDKKRDAEEAQEEAIQLKKEMKMEDTSHEEYQFLDEEVFVLPIILKTDVLGTLEAVEKEVSNIKIENVKIKIIGRGVGPVNEKDIQLAKSDRNSVVIAFHTVIDKKASEMAEIYGVKINSFDIIYKLSEWLDEFTKNTKPKKEVEEVVGSLKVIRVFNRSKDSQVVGGKVYSGSIKNKHTIQIVRKDMVIGRGKIVELQQFKQSANEVKEGGECGLMIDSKYDIAEGDFLQMVVKKIV
jgi:translation initiation factor IF-2